MKAAHQGLPMADLPGMAGRSYEPAPQPTPAPVIAPQNPLTSMLAPAQGPAPFSREDDMRPLIPAAPPRPPVAVAPPAPPALAPARATPPRPPQVAAAPSASPRPAPAPRAAAAPRPASAARQQPQYAPQHRRSRARRCRSAMSRARPPPSAPASRARSRPPRTTARASGISSAICSGSAEGGVSPPHPVREGRASLVVAEPQVMDQRVDAGGRDVRVGGKI